MGGWRWHGEGVRGEVAWGRGEEDQDEEEDQPEDGMRPVGELPAF